MFRSLFFRLHQIKRLKKLTGVFPFRLKYYETAFVPRSSVPHTQLPGTHNERLEYLGDAILETIISEYLCKQFPDKNEGFLTKTRSKFVKRENLNLLAKKLGINNFLEPPAHQQHAKNVLGNILEALIGAVFVDRGYQKARYFVVQILIRKFTNMEQLVNMETDFKSPLIEWGQKNHREIHFVTIESADSTKSSLPFESTVQIGTFGTSVAYGISKKEAEQAAAHKALILLKDKFPSEII